MVCLYNDFKGSGRAHRGGGGGDGEWGGLTSLGYLYGYVPTDVVGVLEVLFYDRFFYIREDRVPNMRCTIGSFTSLVGKSISGYNF